MELTGKLVLAFLLFHSARSIALSSKDTNWDVDFISNSVDKTTKVVKRVRRETKKDENKNSVTFEERKTMIKKHNEYRSGVSPAASNMKFMKWDTELASMAQEWANSCKFAHGQPHRDKPPYSWIGQNLWLGTGGYNEVSLIGAWYDEVSHYTYSTKSCDNVCGHYTQVVWASSHKLGCGIAFCPSLNNAYLAVCNYGPGGNYKGASPYKQGTSCSSCDTAVPKCENKLCRTDPVCKDTTCPSDQTVLEDTCECSAGGFSHASRFRQDGSLLAMLLMVCWEACARL